MQDKEPEEMSGSKYLEFYLGQQGQKTQIWHVYSKNHGSFLGYIKWFGRWRQYAFFPSPETVWNPECLRDICDFIRNLMDDRRKGKLR
jgi:hypothetical protein